VDVIAMDFVVVGMPSLAVLVGGTLVGAGDVSSLL